MEESLPLVLPRVVRPGQTLGVCAPAGPVLDPDALAEGLAWLRGAGFGVVESSQLSARKGYLAGSDDERAAALLELLRAPEVDGILLARGGYGISRLLRQLDPLEFRAARKPIIGYSDATTLLLFLRRCAGLASIHGPMFERENRIPLYSPEFLDEWAFSILSPPMNSTSDHGGAT